MCVFIIIFWLQAIYFTAVNSFGITTPEDLVCEKNNDTTKNDDDTPTALTQLHCPCNMIGYKCLDPFSICQAVHPCKQTATLCPGVCVCKSNLLKDVGGRCVPANPCQLAVSTPYATANCLSDGSAICGLTIAETGGCDSYTLKLVKVYDEYNSNLELVQVNTATSPFQVQVVNQASGLNAVTAVSPTGIDIQCYKMTATDTFGFSSSTSFCVEIFVPVNPYNDLPASLTAVCASRTGASATNVCQQGLLNGPC